MPLENFRPVSTTFFSPWGLMYQTLLGLVAVPAGVGHVDAAVVANDQVVAAKSLGDHRRLACGVVGQNLVAAGGHGIEPAVGPEGLAVALLRVGQEQAHLAVEADLVGLAVGDVVEEDLALGVGAGPSVNWYPSARAPVLAGQQDLLSAATPRPAFTGAGQSFQSQRMASGKTSVACLPLWPPLPQTWLTS